VELQPGGRFSMVGNFDNSIEMQQTNSSSLHLRSSSPPPRKLRFIGTVRRSLNQQWVGVNAEEKWA
jgi:hypothetical protein